MDPIHINTQSLLNQAQPDHPTAYDVVSEYNAAIKRQGILILVKLQRLSQLPDY